MTISLELPSPKKYEAMGKLGVFNKKRLIKIKEEDNRTLEVKTQKALKTLNLYKNQTFIARDNKGKGETRTVILGNNHGTWCQLVKIWADTKEESLAYAKSLLKE